MQVSQGLCWNCLDDIICISCDLVLGVKDQLTLIRVLWDLGLYIAWNKACSATYKYVYLGIQIDTNDMCLRFPAERLEKLRTEFYLWTNHMKATEKQFQILTGHLSHCALIIQGANLYMHFLYTLLAEARGKRKIKLSLDFLWLASLAFFKIWSCLLMCKNTVPV